MLAAAPLSQVRSSPARRALETAHLVADGLPVEIDEDLRGMSLGIPAAGPLRALADFEKLFGRPERRPAEGESIRDVLERGRRGLQTAVEELRGQASACVLVSHRIVNSVLLADLLGLEPAQAVLIQQDPGAVNVLEVRPRSLAVAMVNIAGDDPLRSLAARPVLPDSDTPVDRRLYLIRHGESSNTSRDGRLRSSAASPLTERGRAQAAILAEWFAAVPDLVIHCSDLPRAAETAAALADGREVQSRVDLREMSLGQLEGRSAVDLFAACPGFMSDPDAAPSGGESPRALERRVRAVAEDVLSREDSLEVALVAHGGVVRVLAGSLLGVPPERALGLRTDWASVTILDSADGRWWLRMLNHTPLRLAELARLAPLPGISDEQGWLLGR